MAEWAQTRVPPQDVFSRVLDLHEQNRRQDIEQPNYSQCLAISAFAVGRQDLARQFINDAFVQIERVYRAFSGWSYLELRRDEFKEELDTLRRAIESGQGVPAVVSR
jgi:hypothetical protein